MTITPQHAKFVRDIVWSYRDWSDALVAGGHVAAANALASIKRTLAAYRASCPECGAPMETRYRRLDVGGGVFSTFQLCAVCGTCVRTTTRCHG